MNRRCDLRKSVLDVIQNKREHSVVHCRDWGQFRSAPDTFFQAAPSDKNEITRLLTTNMKMLTHD